jgi:molybdopterin-containing oxidoreductase family membrane subunit
VIGVFADPAQAARAVEALRRSGHGDVRAAMPAPFPEVVEALGRPTSGLGLVTLAGALLGAAAGLALTVGTALAWPLTTGGKPIVSLQPFLIIVFETTVLLGAIANLFALIVVSARGKRRRHVPADPRFTADRIGVFVPGDAAGADEVLRRAGAEEVRRVA